MFKVSVREPVPPFRKSSQYNSRLAPEPLTGLLCVNGVYCDGDPVNTWPNTAKEGMLTTGEPRARPGKETVEVQSGEPGQPRPCRGNAHPTGAGSHTLRYQPEGYKCRSCGYAYRTPEGGDRRDRTPAD